LFYFYLYVCYGYIYVYGARTRNVDRKFCPFYFIYILNRTSKEIKCVSQYGTVLNVVPQQIQKTLNCKRKESQMIQQYEDRSSLSQTWYHQFCRKTRCGLNKPVTPSCRQAHHTHACSSYTDHQRLQESRCYV
jgi:hypothetical protein